MDKRYLEHSMIKYRRFDINDKWISNDNFDTLLCFIGQYNNIYKEKDNLIANAYIAIRKKTDEILRVKSKHNTLKTTKAEIKSIRKSFNKFISNDRIIKIPYKISFIFQAIFEIVEDIKKRVNLPDILKNIGNGTYRDKFYSKFYNRYMDWYNNDGRPYREAPLYERDNELYNDFNAEDSYFLRQFP